jgi:4-hydroxy-2-oxoheptanedioate aldolase
MKTLKELAKSDVPVLGTWISLSDPSVVEFIKWAGFDFVGLDNEYFPFDYDMTAQIIRTANNIKIPIFVRISRMEDISTFINTGANGIMIPECTYERAQEAVARIKYAPAGRRSMFGLSRAMLSAGLDFKEYYNLANDRIALIVQIEGQDGMADIDRILTLKGVDLISTGRLDISQSIGMPGEANHPMVDKFENEVISKALHAGKELILGANTEKDAKNILVKNNVRMLIVSRDIVLLTNGMNALIKNFRT